MSTLGFLVKTYPKISETFILEEILGLEQLGLKLHLFSLQHPTDAIAHADMQRVRAPLTYLDAPGTRALRTLLRHPVRSLRALWLLVRHRDVSWRHVRQGAALAAAMTRHGITHVHSHFISDPATTARVATVLTGTTFSISAHAKDIYLSPAAVLRRKLGEARFTVTCTDHNRDYLLRHAPSGARLSRMYHGIDLERFRRDGEPSSGRPPLILSVGRLKRKKGLHLLLEACHLLREKGINFRCEIVGYGDELANLQRQISDLDLADRIHLPGKLDRSGVIARYRDATVFALPCLVDEDGDRDGLPNVLLEAMAMSLPVLSTPVSGIPELLTDNDNGLLVPPGDASALADALQRLLHDAALRQRLGQRGRATVASHCSNARNLLLLRRLLSQHHASGTPAVTALEDAHAQR